MSVTTAVTEMLGIRHPIIQAPMASATSAEIVAAVSNAGGLGSLGAAYLAPDTLRAEIDEIRRATDRPFMVNLFVPDRSTWDAACLDRANAALQPIRVELGVSPPSDPPRSNNAFAEQFEVLIEARVPVFSFHFGIPEGDAVARAKAVGMVVAGSATTVADAKRLADAGADIVVAQGVEAGGHQGTFDVETEPSMIGVHALVRQVVDVISVPVIAAGGIMDGGDIAAVLKAGAGAAQMGTAFLVCPESVAHPCHKRAVLEAGDDTTRLTRAFSGRPARGLVNRFIDEIGAQADAILPFPYQTSLTGPIRAAAAKQNRPEFMSLWAGQGVARARARPAGELVGELATELEQHMEGATP